MTVEERELSEQDRADFARLLPPPVAKREMPRPGPHLARLHRHTAAAPGRRLRVPVPVLAAGALAATVAVAAVGGAVLNRQSDSPPAGTRVTTLAQLLDRADARAATEPIVRASDDQFVYTRGVTRSQQSRESWQSVDGTRTGLLIDGEGTSPLDGVRPARPVPPLELAIDFPTFRSLAGLRTTPTDLLAAITRVRAGQGSDPDDEAFDALRSMLTETIVPPAVRVLIYRTAAIIPGTRFVPDRVDGAGRHGAALVFAQQEIIVDPVTTAFRGDRELGVVASGIVDRLRQRPAGVTGPALPPAPAPGTPSARPDPDAKALRDVDWRNATLTVPPDGTSYPGGRLSFVDGVTTVARPDGAEVTYEIRPAPVYADLNGDRRDDAVLAIAERGTSGSADSSYLFLAYTGAAGGAPRLLGTVYVVQPQSVGPTFTVEGGVVTVSPRYVGTPGGGGSPVSRRWNGTSFVPVE